MNCDDAKALLRERFDAGLPLDRDLSGHVESCLACRRYRTRLEALDRCLAELPGEAPAPGFAARVRAGIAADARRRRFLDRLVWGGAAAATAAVAATLGWLYPIELQPRTWWQALRDAIPDLRLSDWQAAATGTADMLRAAQSSLREPVGLLPEMPPALAWSAAASLVLFLLLFNVFEAHDGGRETNGG